MQEDLSLVSTISTYLLNMVTQGTNHFSCELRHLKTASIKGVVVQDLQAEGPRLYQDETVPCGQSGPGDCP